MTTTVFLAVFAAAMLHAVWNAMVKGGSDKHLNMAAVMLAHAPIATIALLFVPAPAPPSWPWLAAGLVFHFGYQLSLLGAYRAGDLTQVYPIARGSAPLLVAGISVVFLGVQLEPAELIAVLIIGAGIISLSAVRQGGGLRNTKAAGLAFLTGCFIAGYSLVDGMGARLAGTSLGFLSWLMLGNAILFAAFTAWTRPGLLRTIPTRALRVFAIGGGASFIAYALVVWAFTQAPIALVTAVRETSIVFALMIGVFFLREKLDLAKVASTMVTLFGTALLRFSQK